MKLTALAAAIGIAATSTAAVAEPVNLTLSGGNPGGLWSLLGAGIDRATKVDDADSVVTYQATGGGFANIGLLGANRTDLGLVHDAEAKIALQGGEPLPWSDPQVRLGWRPIRLPKSEHRRRHWSCRSLPST